MNRVTNETVAVVVVNWNNWEIVLKCLGYLRKSVQCDWHLFIVDNASTDGGIEHFAGLGEDVTLIASEINGGWSGGNNLGITAALEAGYEILFLLNSDAFVEPSTIKTLLDAKGHMLGGPIFGPIHMDLSGNEYDFVGTDVDHRTGLPIWKSVSASTVEEMPAIYDTSMIKGAAIFADTEHFSMIGLMDDDFFLNFDETDWCYRCRDFGYRLLMVRSSRVYHFGSASIGGAASPLQLYFLARNSLLFARKHSTLPQRARHLRNLYWDFRDLGTKGIAGTVAAFVFSIDLNTQQRAFRAGVLDYMKGRFGDCPRYIREMRMSSTA